MQREGFEQVYEDHHELVLHVAFDILKDYDLAQEVCEKVFVEFYYKMKRLDERRAKGWLLKHACREANRLARRSWRRKKTPEAGEKDAQEAAVECMVERNTGKDRKRM